LRFIDTNVFIRQIAQDDREKAAASEEFFRRLESDNEEALTSEMVVGEVVYVLSARGHYDFPRTEIRDRLMPILVIPRLRLPAKEAVLRALSLYVQYPVLDFEDALSVAHMEAAGITEIVSYDRGFDRVEGVVRVEPGG
jgi:predicted nucleic acid-binding protein